MSRLEITVRLVDDEGQPIADTEPLRLSQAALDLAQLQPGAAIDQLETEIVAQGFDWLRQTLVWRIEQLDAQLAAQRTHETEACQVTLDGRVPLTIATVVGRIEVSRQASACQPCAADFIPLNRILPAHDGILITRGLQELSALLALWAPYAPTDEVVKRMTHDPRVLSARQIEDVVLAHGQAVRTAEAQEAATVLASPGLSDQPAVLVPSNPPRRELAWPDAVSQAVETALQNQDWQNRPTGVTAADWDRIVTQMRIHPEAEATLRRVARLGPQLQPDELLLTLDGITLRGQEQGSQLELRVARLATNAGYRYISGVGDAFLTKVQAAIHALDGARRFLVVLADGAHWIREFFAKHLAPFTRKELVLDWYHLTKKCKELLSMVVCGGRPRRREVLRQVMPLLWEGKVREAIAVLQGLAGEARHPDKLQELIGYLEKHQTEIPNYKLRRANCQYNGSGSAEKSCDLLVARRQKRKGMHWVEKGADALCALQTLWHNGGWDLYWKLRQVLPLRGPVNPVPCAC